MSAKRRKPAPSDRNRQPSRAAQAPAAPPSGHTWRAFWREAGVIAACCLATGVAASLIFQPLAWWPLAFVCLAPWATAVCRAHRAWLAHWLSFATGFLFFLVNLRWLMPVTGLGYSALAFYLGLYWPLAAWALRTGVRRGLSPIWTLPVVWVATEFLRAWVMTGFPWFFLAHSFAEAPLLIQISDLTGAYGVTFLAALANGVFVEAALAVRPRHGARRRLRQLACGAVVMIVALAATTAYGFKRLGENDFVQGPRVSVIQHDFPLVSAPPYGASPPVMLSAYMNLAAREVAEERPDLVVFPETAWSSTQNKDFVEGDAPENDERMRNVWLFGRMCHGVVSAFASGDYEAANREFQRLRWSGRRIEPIVLEYGPPVAVVLGAMSTEVTGAAYPSTLKFNSAFVYDADGAQRARRYDKVHLVPFGELVPFRSSAHFHWLYLWLNSLSPFSGNDGADEYTLTRGDELTVFDLETERGVFRFGVPICYEDVTPYVSRCFVWGAGERRADFLINISNDGWFLHSAELPQHLAICIFRAVENRVGVVRSVNTGISGFIDPNGRLYSLVEDAEGRRVLNGKGVVGCKTDYVLIDRRDSFYGRHGDWFALTCLVLAIGLWGEGVASRWAWAARVRIRAWLRRRGERDAATN